jgi:hypothetical protein
MLETVPEGATHVTEDMRMFINEHFDHLETIKNQIPVLARIVDLKRLVESIDLVNSYGGVQESEWEISSQDDLPEHCYRLRQAIDDYEAIYGGEHV